MNRVPLSACVLALCWGGTAHAADWAMDAGASKLEFVVRYEGEPTVGRFRKFDTRLQFDPRRPEESHLRVTVDVESADMDSGDINATIRGAEWFNAARYGRARFDSRRITREKAGDYVAHGTLMLKGIEREIAVPFAWQSAGRSATMTGRFDLRRTAFNIGTGDWSDGNTIGLEVEVRFDVHLRRIND
ncbi:MAG: YceI family protein [Chromatiaceae bacterium]